MEKSTAYQLSISLNDEIVEITIGGEIRKREIESLHKDVISIISDHKAKSVICDITSLKGRFDEFAAAYFRVRNIPKNVGILPTAVVDQSKNEAYRAFYETTASNVGQRLKWFYDMESARSWIKAVLK